MICDKCGCDPVPRKEQGFMGRSQKEHDERINRYSVERMEREAEIEYLKAQLVIGKEENADLRTALAEQISATTEAARQLAEAKEEIKLLKEVLDEIDRIRNSIIGFQAVNWSEHVYPLVAALDKVGYAGKGYEENKQNAQNLIVTVKRLEAELAALRLEWKIGKVMISGWYWVKWFGSPMKVTKYNSGEGPNDLCKWAGPIQQPAEPPAIAKDDK